MEALTVQEKQNLYQFTEKVFQYYNGRINPNIPAKLIISSKAYPEIPMGQCIYPNLVVVYAIAIGSSGIKMNGCYSFIIGTIIHELYHVEQSVLYANEYYCSKDIKRIEPDVEFMTASYILNHMEEIKRVFGVDMVFHNIMQDVKSSIQFGFYPNNIYKRRDIIDHLFGLLESVFYDMEYVDYKKIADIPKDMVERLASDFYHALINPVSIICVTINGSMFQIKDHEWFMDYETFNQYIYTFYTKYDVITNMKVDLVKACEPYMKHYYRLRITFKPYYTIATKVGDPGWL